MGYVTWISETVRTSFPRLLQIAPRVSQWTLATLGSPTWGMSETSKGGHVHTDTTWEFHRQLWCKELACNIEAPEVGGSLEGHGLFRRLHSRFATIDIDGPHNDMFPLGIMADNLPEKIPAVVRQFLTCVCLSWRVRCKWRGDSLLSLKYNSLLPFPPESTLIAASRRSVKTCAEFEMRLY